MYFKNVSKLIPLINPCLYVYINQQAKKKTYKKGIDQEDGRRRRTETTIQLRKEKKEDFLTKRRTVRISCILISLQPRY